jgi:hypothetical protein
MIFTLVALVLQLRAVSADQSCAGSSLGGQPGIFLTIASQAPADTLLRAAVCYVGSSTVVGLGSYHGRLFYDSTKVKALRAEEISQGYHAENLARSGVVDFAGASASGFESGPLLEVLFRAPHDYRAALRLEMIEANSVTRGPLLPQLKIVGVLQTGSAQTTNLSGASCTAQASPASRAPTLTRLVPAVVPFDSLVRGAVVTIQGEGCGFDKERNIVRLGRFVIAEVPSSADGTRISFAFPTEVPTGGEVAPPKPAPGSYSISVSKGSLTSNSLTLEVR